MQLSSRAPFTCRSCSRTFEAWSKHFNGSYYKSYDARRAINSTAAAPRPFRLAIIGSGPAGFYTASRLIREHNDSHIDMYERLPIPYGLVRYGVAPDHPEVKNCQDRFEEIATLPNFNFIGNINVGHNLPLQTLKPHYDAILFAYGASMDRRLDIPGENLNEVYSARDFVGWYNGLPGYSDLRPALDRGPDAVVVGQGNVALDVARILLTDVDQLRKTDMPEYALDLLSHSRISKVHAVGRRGPIQAAFTIKEAREIINIPGVAFSPIPRDLFPKDLKSLPRARRRIAELLVKSGSATSGQYDQQKSFSFDFLLSPSEFTPSKGDTNRLESVRFQLNQYDNDSDPFDPGATVIASLDEKYARISASVAFRSIGYRSEPIPGFAALNVPFNRSRGTIPNQLGRVVSSSADGLDVTPPVPGIYVAGWVKRGPTGVIASTMEDAFGTADSIMQDLKAGRPFLNHDEGGSTGLGWEGLRKEAEGRGLRSTSWEDWKTIDRVERKRGKRLGKEREKITEVDEMLRVLDN